MYELFNNPRAVAHAGKQKSGALSMPVDILLYTLWGLFGLLAIARANRLPVRGASVQNNRLRGRRAATCVVIACDVICPRHRRCCIVLASLAAQGARATARPAGRPGRPTHAWVYRVLLWGVSLGTSCLFDDRASPAVASLARTTVGKYRASSRFASFFFFINRPFISVQPSGFRIVGRPCRRGREDEKEFR